MRSVLLDTDIFSEFLRGNSSVIQQVNKYLETHDKISLSIITYYEVLNGLFYKDAKSQLKRFDEFISLNDVLQLTMSATRKAAEIFAELRKKGTPIGHTDCLIAGIALSNDLELATNNTNHFRRVNGLQLVNWLESDA
jgi:predicted nucleic acid-binding protein